MSLPVINPLTLLNLASDPASGSVGDMYYNTTSGGIKVCTNAIGPVWSDVGGGGGSATWGSITGTLSNQTDLQTALNAKANLSGATFTGSVTVPNAFYNTSSPITTNTVGNTFWDTNYSTLDLVMTSGTIGQIMQDDFIYAKASSAITKGQLCMFTGVVGASGTITAAPATGVTVAQYVVGVAAESIALNGFGMIQILGPIKGFDTTGSSVGETWVNGDILYYNSAYAGGMTHTYPTSGPIVMVAAVINVGSGGSGSLLVRPTFTQRFSGTSPISVSQAPTGSSISIQQATTSQGGYLSSTDWNTFNSKQPAGTYVTSVSGTAPVVSSGGTTPAISMAKATGAVDGYLSSTDWTTFNNKTSNTGTVTSVATSGPLTGGTITTTGTIGIQVATSLQNGYLSSTDWNTFNNKSNTTGTVTSIATSSPLTGGTITGSGTIGIQAATAAQNGYMSSTYASKLDGIAAGATNVTNTNQLTNGSGYITGINSSMVTTALGYTPYNSTNPSGYITSSGSCNYATSSGSVSSLSGHNISELSNNSGYITSSGSCNYATSSGSVSSLSGHTTSELTNNSGFISGKAGLPLIIHLQGQTLANNPYFVVPFASTLASANFSMTLFPNSGSGSVWNVYKKTLQSGGTAYSSASLIGTITLTSGYFTPVLSITTTTFAAGDLIQITNMNGNTYYDIYFLPTYN